MSPSSAEEIQFQIHALTLTAKRWNKGATHKAIALHGWLDNCGSFDPLAQELNDVDLIALDSAGHGHSSFRSADGQYLIWSEVSEIFAIADQLGWQTFNLIGHSRGAGIAAICAGTFPERIEKLMLIEGGIPLPMEAKDVPENLARHILDDTRLSSTQGSLFSSRDQAITARANGFTNITKESSEILAIRALREEDGGFRWHADARLKAPSSLKLTHGQIDAFLDHISAPVLLIEGKEGIIRTMPFTSRHLAKITHLRQILLPGGHHLHMENSTTECAKALIEFLSS